MRGLFILALSLFFCLCSGADTIFSANLDSNPGWATTGEWAFGVPAGNGGDDNGNPDPVSGATGTNVFGVNLAGDYSTAPGGPYCLTAGPFNLVGYENVAISFQRWLNSDYLPYVSVKFQVSAAGGPWQTIWENDDVAPIEDNAWSLVNYDLSAAVDNQPNVYVRWCYTIGGSIEDPAFAYSGWNVDDIVLEGDQFADLVNTPAISVSEPSRWYVRSDHQLVFIIYYFGATSVSLSSPDVTLLSTGTATGDVYVTGTGTSERKVRILNMTGEGTLGIAIAPGTASDGMGNWAPGVAGSPRAVLDNLPPDIYCTPPSLNSTDDGPCTYTLLYGGAYGVILKAVNVTLQKTGTANGVKSVLGSGRYKRKARVNSTTGDGTIGVSVAAGTAYDQAGNVAAAVPPSATFVVDNTPPLDPAVTLPIITIGPPNFPTASSTKTVKYTVVYRDFSSITLAPGDVNIMATGSAAATAGISGTGGQRQISLTGISGDGTIQLSLDAGTASNGNGPASAAGPSVSFEVDNTPPSVYITAPSFLDASTGPVTWTVLFSGAQNVLLTAGHVNVISTGTAAAGTVTITGAGRFQRKVRLGSLTGTGTLAVSLNAGTATDSAGNAAGAVAKSEFCNVAN